MSYDELIAQINMLDSHDPYSKNYAFEYLYKVEKDTNFQLLFPQLLQSNDLNFVFYGLKFAENLVLKTNAQIQALSPQLILFLQQLTLSQAPFFLRQKASQLLFTMSFFNLASFPESLIFLSDQKDDQLVTLAAEALSQLSQSLISLHWKGVPIVILRNFKAQLIQFFHSSNFVSFSQKIQSENSAKALANLLIFPAKSQPQIINFVFSHMKFCQISEIFKPGNCEFFTILLKICNNIFADLKELQLDFNFMSQINELFWIVALVCNELKTQFNSILCSELTVFMKNIVFSRFFNQFIKFSIETQINKTISIDSAILYKQRNVEKVNLTIYSSMCKMLESVTVIYQKCFETSDINLMNNLLECVLQVLNVQCEPKMKKYLLDMYKDTFIQLIDMIIYSIQRPTEVLYFKNEFGEVIREKIEESNLINLNNLQLSVLTSIVGNFSIQNQYFEKLHQMSQNGDVCQMQQLTYVYPAYAASVELKYTKNNTLKIKFVTQTMQLFLSIADALQLQNDKLLAYYCSIYVASKSITQVSTSLKLSYIIKSYNYLSSGIPDITEATVQLLIAIFNSLNLKDVQLQSEFFEQQILLPIFSISTTYLDQYQIRDFYSTLTQIITVDDYLGILLFPVQNHFSEIVKNLNQSIQTHLFTNDAICNILNIFQIIFSCSVNINSVSLDQFIEPIYEQIRVIWNFYWQNQQQCDVIVQSLIKVIYQVLKQLILHIDKVTFKNKYDGFIEYIISQEITRLKLFCETEKALNVELIQFLDLLTVRQVNFELFLMCFEQLQKVQSIEEVINTFWLVFQSFFENGAILHTNLVQEQKIQFQSVFVTISTQQRFSTSFSQQLLIRFADQINFCILRRSGQQFISFYLLELIKTNFSAPEQFILNVFQQAKGVLGVEYIANILRQNMTMYFDEVLQDVLSGSDEGVRDLRVLSNE
ncbi:hypothetical protein SS50377_22330 [Spironucleus salmonicida]|uniref:Uncharacterized protein n=1 Tax=Spironucleus salmonicida TaxID=348837 RepID=V6LES7_9EUKA|nr:hypothetical protein SS50377_22330 [Spironucleus salmonicida]|eukprot:EST42176.1 Hypothetical protein SS50377_18482 [Spironucleus salmonicida]